MALGGNFWFSKLLELQWELIELRKWATAHYNSTVTSSHP